MRRRSDASAAAKKPTSSTDSDDELKLAELNVKQVAVHAKPLKTDEPLDDSYLNPSLDEGETIQITVGAETYSPVRYNTFTVGPLSVTVRVRKGELAGDAYARGMRFAETMFETEFQLKARSYMSRIRELAVKVRESREE